MNRYSIFSPARHAIARHERWDRARRRPGPALAVAEVTLRADPMVLPPCNGALLRARSRRAFLILSADLA